MFGVGTGEIVLILAIAMLVVGPERMVTFARQAGELIAKFRQQTDSVTAEFREALSLDPESTSASASSAQTDGATTPAHAAGAETERPVGQVETGAVSSAPGAPTAPASRPNALFSDGEVAGASRLSAQASVGHDGDSYTDGRAVAIDIAGNDAAQSADEPTFIDEPQLVVDELDPKPAVSRGGDDTP